MYRVNKAPDKKEKICAALCYPTFGIVGIIYIIVTAGKAGLSGSQTPFLRYHLIQAILLGFLAYLCSLAAGPLLDILIKIMAAVVPGVVPSVVMVLSIVLTILRYGFYLLLGYGALWAILGKFAEMPIISNLVRRNMR